MGSRGSGGDDLVGDLVRAVVGHLVLIDEYPIDEYPYALDVRVETPISGICTYSSVSANFHEE